MEHGGDVLGVKEGVLGENSFEVMDEELYVTIREEKISASKGEGRGGQEEVDKQGGEGVTGP